MQLQILSIDDSKAVLKYIEWVFSKSNHSVETFLSGREAMLTSKNNEEDIKKAIEYGVEEFIMKPFTPELLLEKIEEICE